MASEVPSWIRVGLVLRGLGTPSPAVPLRSSLSWASTPTDRSLRVLRADGELRSYEWQVGGRVRRPETGRPRLDPDRDRVPVPGDLWVSGVVLVLATVEAADARLISVDQRDEVLGRGRVDLGTAGVGVVGAEALRVELPAAAWSSPAALREAATLQREVLVRRHAEAIRRVGQDLSGLARTRRPRSVDFLERLGEAADVVAALDAARERGEAELARLGVPGAT